MTPLYGKGSIYRTQTPSACGLVQRTLSSNGMTADPPPNPSAIRRAVTAPPVERSREGRLPALLAPDPDDARHGIADLREVESVHMAASVEELQSRMAAPSVKLHLPRIRMLFDWLVVALVLPTNPASAACGPKHSVRLLEHNLGLPLCLFRLDYDLE